MNKRTASTSLLRPYKFTINVTNHVADTLHLSAEAHGCYLRLLFSYWRVGPPADDDYVLARIAGCTLPRWRKVRPAIQGYFLVYGGQWIHEEVDEELQTAYTAINKAREAGKKAAQARWKGKYSTVKEGVDESGDKNAGAMRSQCESHTQLKIEVPASDNTCGVIKSPQEARAKEAGLESAQYYESDVFAAEKDLGVGGDT